MNKILKNLELPTKNDNTKEKYLNRGRQLYKNSVLYYLEQNNTEEAIEAIEYLREINSKGCILKSEKTSSNKLKKIPMEDWEKINKYLENNYGKWHKELQLWLKSAYLTGLRPIEWQDAKLITYNNEQALLVKNAKHTNGRAHGEERTIILKGLKETEWKIIKQHLHNVYNFKAMDDYEFFYRGCSHTLYRICRDLWPKRRKHVTLYSTRHQFSANAKASGMTKPQLAALMGHAVEDTATLHYGRKSAGREEIAVEPIEVEVGKIRISDKPDFKDKKEEVKK